MPVVAVVNRKGGSGKSTLATHLAVYCSRSGIPVMLGDVDKQQSTQAWLRLRATQPIKNNSPIVGWTVDPRSVLRAPAGVTHVVLDTPGGLRGFDLARVAMFADAIIMPVCNSVFDRESAADCYAELLTLPRVASGRCKVAAIGMRVDARTKGDETLKEWADAQKLPFIGVLRETQGYVKCVERGLTMFDLAPSQVKADLEQWEPILNWLQPVLHAAPRSATEAIKRPIDAAEPADVLRRPTTPTAPPQASVMQLRPTAPQPADTLAALCTPATQRPAMPSRPTGFWAALSMPRFLQR